jgi:hypothetical protein
MRWSAAAPYLLPDSGHVHAHELWISQIVCLRPAKAFERRCGRIDLRILFGNRHDVGTRALVFDPRPRGIARVIIVGRGRSGA